MLVLGAVAIGLPILVLIWGAIITSHQIQRRTGYPASPDGLFVTLLAACVAAAVFSLPFEISSWVFMLVSVPIAVWVYLAVLQRRLALPAATAKQDRTVRAA